MRRPGSYLHQTRHFVREYTAGLNVRDFKRLFEQEAPEAYAVLARDQAPPAVSRGRVGRFLHHARVVFLGVSARLTPARRALFALALLCALLGLANPDFINVNSRALSLTLGTSTFWFTLAVAALIFLLVIELVDRVRVRDELEVARQLQRDLLPRAAPEVAGYRFAHSYRTANEVGGDYYDFPVLPDGRVALLVGDASGHGIAAGLLMAIANATLKTALDVDPEPRKVASLLNRTLYRTGDRRAFMTLFYGLLDPASGRLDYVCGGHPFPLLRRAGGEIYELGRGTLPLGMRETLELESQTVTIEPGDLLLLYTDGLPEAVDRQQGQAFGFDRLRSLLAAVGGPAAVHDRILLALDDHAAGQPLHDDLTLVVMTRSARVEAPDGAEPAPLPPESPPGTARLGG